MSLGAYVNYAYTYMSHFIDDYKAKIHKYTIKGEIYNTLSPKTVLFCIQCAIHKQMFGKYCMTYLSHKHLYKIYVLA